MSHGYEDFIRWLWQTADALEAEGIKAWRGPCGRCGKDVTGGPPDHMALASFRLCSSCYAGKLETVRQMTERAWGHMDAETALGIVRSAVDAMARKPMLTPAPGQKRAYRTRSAALDGVRGVAGG